MNFWIIAVVLLLIAAAAFCWPLFSGTARDRITSVSIVLVIPVLGLALYQVIGTPEAIGIPVAKPQPGMQSQAQMPHAEGGGEIDTMLQQLQQRLTENPDDPDGWLILGRTLRSQQRFAEAQSALENANGLLPNTPAIMVELAEARLFASGSPVITSDIRQLLESAVEMDPHQQKGLWLLGMAESEDGNFQKAIDTWQSLLGLLEPGSGSAQRVSEQIARTQAVLGEGDIAIAAEAPAPAQPTGPVSVAESGIPVTVSIDTILGATLPGGAPLFVFIHPTGGAGMPLAVKRLAAAGFPMALNFTDADLLQPGNSLANFDQLDISARIALGGSVNPTTGDIQAARVTVDTKDVQAITLHLDQLVP